MVLVVVARMVERAVANGAAEMMLERPRQRSVVKTLAGTRIASVDERFSGRKHVAGVNG
ncbi:MAG: hypothetical protein WBF75_21350 [Pseudonocardiaceae bacterium]